MGKEPDVDEDAEPALQLHTEPAVGPEDPEPLPSNETALRPEDLEPLPLNEILADDSQQPEVHCDDAGNEPDTSTDTDDLPDIGMDRPLRVAFGKELRYAPTLAERICCRRHRDGTLQSVPLPWLVTSIVALYHESEFYVHSGLLRTMALIKRDYVCSHL